MPKFDLSHFEKFVSHVASRQEWTPFVRGLREIPERHHAELARTSKVLLEWAESYLGEKYLDALAEGYVAFVADVNRSQLRYEMTGHYQNSSYAEVFERVYGNEDFMKFYHWGVFASTFSWPHHLDLMRFFRERFIDLYVKPSGISRSIDLGCGSGLWSFLLLTQSKELKAQAVDISETSVKNTSEMSASIGLESRFSIDCGDALNWGQDTESEQFDFGVSCFLLEHLETPEQLLGNLSRLLKPRGVAFVTGALTAAETDHIKEFRRESELLEMAEGAGFRVMEVVSASPDAYMQDGRFLPRSMAMILSKRQNEVW